MKDALPAPGQPRSRILIADDCATSRLVEEIILRCGGYETLIALDGAAAVEVARAQAPDLILLDLWMPKLSGLEALRELKRSPPTRDVPVIVVATSADPEVFRAAADSGCDAFLVKPFEAEALLLSVEKNLVSSRLRALRDRDQPCGWKWKVKA